MTINSRNISQSISLNLWFIRLRWIASIVALLLVVITVKVFHYLPDDNLWPLLYLIFILALTNLVYSYFLKKNIFIKHLKELQIVTDLLILTFMLHYSGGIENPLSFVFLFHVILSGILLEKKKSYIVVALAFLLYFSMAIFELTDTVPHYTLNIFPHTDSDHNVHTVEDGDKNQITGHEAIHAAHYAPYVWSSIVLNLFMMLLTAFFITTIVERLRSEERKTEEERQRLDHVLYATNAGLVILDKNLEIVWYNEPVKSLLSLKSTNNLILHTKILNWLDGKEGPAAETLKDGIIRSVESEKVDDKGQRQYFQVTIAPLTNDKGEVYQVVELIQDISQKKILEAEMLHTAKMVTLGTMAAGIAHEVGNPLASISTRLNLLETENDPSFVSQSVKLLQREISRIDRIVRGISQFGRSPKKEWGICKINQILKETIEMLKYHKVARACVIDFNLSSNLPDILGVTDQLKQVFLNIGLNSLEAMPAGGTLTITSVVEEGNLEIKFTDNGDGIKKEEIERIFQPFFTTKQKGSGLGLFIVNHFVQAHSGYLEVNSEYGKGTTITVVLPVHLPHSLMKVNTKMS